MNNYYILEIVIDIGEINVSCPWNTVECNVIRTETKVLKMCGGIEEGLTSSI